MNKNLLLAATGVGALALAGAASAHTLSFRTAVAGGAIDTTDLAAQTAYILALESSVTGDKNDFLLIDTLSTGSSLPSGNVLVTVTIEGSTFDSANFNGGDLRGTGACAGTFTAALSSASASQAVFVVSNSAAGCNAFELDVPVNNPTGEGSVTIRTDIRTDGFPGTRIDDPQGSLVIIRQEQAFTPVINAQIGAGAENDTLSTLTVLPVYTTFLTGGTAHDGTPETSTLGQLGTVAINVNTAAHRDLANPTIFATAGDVTDADLVVEGSFSAFDGAGGAVTLGAAPATFGTNTATVANQQVALTTGPQAFRVQRETASTQIPSSEYRAALTYLLNPAFYVARSPNPFTGSLETIERDGTQVVLPWMNSLSVQNANGTTNLVRLGNTGSSATGPVFVQVLNSTNGVSGAPVQIFPNIAIGGERLITTAMLTSFLGDFGRGDVQVIVEAPARTITARRFAFTSNGGTTELSNGTVASEQTPADLSDVP